MPHATASVNGVVVAETDTYEVVDGNIYVRQHVSLLSCHFEKQHSCLLPLTSPIVPTQQHNPIPLHTHVHDDTLPVQGRRVVLQRHDQQDGNQGCGVVLSGAAGEYEQD
jgi:hypothetical protein